MAAVARAYTGCRRQGLSIGVVRADPSPPAGASRPWRANACNEWVEVAIQTHLDQSSKSQQSRNHINVLTAHGLIFLPGSAGTESELELAMEYGRPPVILWLGDEHIHGKSADQILQRYPAARQAGDRQSLVELLRLTVGPALG